MRSFHVGLAGAIALVLAACPAGPPTGPTATPKASPKAQATKGPVAPLPTGLATPVPGLKPGDGFVGPNPGLNPGTITPIATPVPGVVPGVIANNGASLTGKVKAPAGLVSNNGGGLVSNNGGGLLSDKGGSFVGKAAYGLLALEEAAVGGVPVALVYADGQPVRDAAGTAIVTTTAADGSYSLPYAGGDANVVALATLAGGRGEVVAFVPRGPRSGATALDLDTTSTFTLGYVLARYVQRDRTILEKLPADMEAKTRSEVARALAAAPPPDALSPGQIVARVEQLRRSDAALDGQLETVRRTLLAGISEQGVGRAVTDVEIGPNRAVRAPNGEIVWADVTSNRVFKRDALGQIAVVAGTGRVAPYGTEADRNQPGPGDGGPATLATLTPNALCYGLDGSLVVTDLVGARLRKIAPDGTISTLAAFPANSSLGEVELAPDGSFRVATAGGVWKVDPDGTATLIAGERVVTLALLQHVATKRASGDGGPPLDARFRGICGMGVDPTNGDTLIYDCPGVIRRIGATTIEKVFGEGVKTIPAGDGGPVAQAVFGPTGDVSVDAQGRYWIVDGIANTMRRVDGDRVARIAGTGDQGVVGDGGDALQAQLGLPLGLWLGSGGEALIVCDGLIRRYLDGKLTTEVGALALDPAPKPASKVQFLSPDSLEIEPGTGAVLITDNRHVWRWRPAADTMEIVVSRGIGGRKFVEGGDAIESFLNLFFAALPGPDGLLTVVASDPADQARVGIIEVRDGKLTTIAGNSNKSALAKLPLATNADFDILTRLTRWQGDYVLGSPLPTPAVYRFQPGGALALVGGGGTRKDDGIPFTEFKLAHVNDLGVGPDGALYVGDFGGLMRVDPATGIATYVVGAPTGPAPSAGALATAVRPKAVAGFAWDAQGRLHFTDAENAKIWRVEADGKLTQIAGVGTGVLAGSALDDSLSLPWGLAIDPAGDLYVTDRSLHQVKRIPKGSLP